MNSNQESSLKRKNVGAITCCRSTCNHSCFWNHPRQQRQDEPGRRRIANPSSPRQIMARQWVLFYVFLVACVIPTCRSCSVVGSDPTRPTWDEFVQLFNNPLEQFIQTSKFVIEGANCPDETAGPLVISSPKFLSCCDFNGGVDDACVIRCPNTQIIVNTTLVLFSFTFENAEQTVLKVESDGMLDASKMTFENNGSPVISDNVKGGAINVAPGGSLYLENAVFYNNYATFGGAIHNEGSTTLLGGDYFSGNQATIGGGAVNNLGNFVAHDVPTEFTNNNAISQTNSSSQGGAIRNVGTLSIEQALFEGNTASVGGALWSGGTAFVTLNVFENNEALLYGPAILDSNNGVVMSQNTGCGNAMVSNSGTVRTTICNGAMRPTVSTGPAASASYSCAQDFSNICTADPTSMYPTTSYPTSLQQPTTSPTKSPTPEPTD